MGGLATFLKTLIGSLCMLMFCVSPAQADSDGYARTRYPIIMVPGAFAFDNVLGLVDYWYGITDELRHQGAEVYVTKLSSAASNVRRGEELLEDIRQIRALTGASRVNLIAHSQGGPAARYVASLKPEWIASVNCVTCLNEGTEFADNLFNFLNEHKTRNATKRFNWTHDHRQRSQANRPGEAGSAVGRGGSVIPRAKGASPQDLCLA